MLQLPPSYGPLPPETVHLLFESAAFLLGGRLYFRARRIAGLSSPMHGSSFWVLLGCVLGAAVGNKLVFLLEYPPLLLEAASVRTWFAGQSVVGGLLGGVLGVELAKKLVGHRASTGDQFVEPILAGLMLGRIGCFLSGLSDGTFGTPTALPWGVDFGDGIARHPAQLYEIAFCALLWHLLARLRSTLDPVPGLGFRLMLSAYLLWRFAVEFLKPLPFPWPGGLSGIQVTCAVALVLYLPPTATLLRRPAP